ncbi:MAG: NAD(P)-dependent oxidoreductase [bacterium]
MKILLTGGNGFIGKEFQDAFADRHIITAPPHSEMDAADERRAEQVIREVEPEVIIHLAGLVDKDTCEREPERAMRTNAESTRIMATAAAKYGIFFFYLSTDLVFSGDRNKPYVESDVTSPANSYGRSKLQGEKYIREICDYDNYLIVRTSGIFGRHGKNFLSTLVRKMQTEPSVKLVDDRISSFTYAPDLADAAGNLLEARASGILHLVNAGACTAWDFALHIKERLSLSTRFEKFGADDYERHAPIPRYRVLASEYSPPKHPPLRAWDAALDEFIDSM